MGFVFHLWKIKLCLHSTWEGGDSTQLTAKQIIIEISGTVYHRLTAQCLVTGETDLISKELSTTSLRMDSSSSFSSSYKYIQFNILLLLTVWLTKVMLHTSYYGSNRLSSKPWFLWQKPIGSISAYSWIRCQSRSITRAPIYTPEWRNTT